MKRKLLTATFSFILLVATSQSSVLADIETSLKNGSAKEFAKFCNSKVTLKMSGENKTVSRAEAESKLRSFFLQNVPSGFSYVHQGSSAEGLKYCIGKYSSGTSSFRVVLLLKESGGTYQVDTITLTKE